MLDGKWRDLHNRPNNETYELLEMLNRHVKKDTYLIIEFYKDFSELIEIYQEVDDWLNSKTTA
jgi:cephalosporin-C deacetylase-like acetyl esterase